MELEIVEKIVQVLEGIKKIVRRKYGRKYDSEEKIMQERKG